MKIKPDTIDYFVTGGKIKVKTLKGVLQNGYKKSQNQISMDMS